MQGLIGEKIGMTRFFNDSGVEIPVTVIKTGTNVVHQVRTLEKDKYAAVQLGFGSIAESRVNKPELGHFKKHSSEPTRVIKEFFLDSAEEQLQSGSRVGVEVLENVKFVDVVGISKGRGHAGCIKRHNFDRGRKTHGNTCYRERGSAGANSYPARVFPGLKMSGHMGSAQVTSKRLELVGVDKENGLVFVRGAVPGRNKGIVFIRKNS